MKLAAIDIGSNSIHMIVAEIDGDGSVTVIDRQKEMVHLGERSLVDGYLGEDAQERGLEALRTFKRMADGYEVADVIAVATSAVREARNGADFIARVADECGIAARMVEGVEEGHLIYLGTREVFDFGARRALIIDIGGGSVEFILADQRRDYLVKSLKLGVRRLKDTFLHSDPPTREELETLRTHIRRRVDFVVEPVRARGFDIALASSGTARALARITAARTGNSPEYVSRADLAETVRCLATATDAERAELPGLDDRRRDAILEGGVLMLTLVETFGADGFTYCDAALREGLIIDYLERNRPGLRLITEEPDPRRRSVVLFARRMYSSIAHARQVAVLSERVFEDLRSLHGLRETHRHLLEFAALLHDVGLVVNRSAHHRHTLYLVQHADLAGFSEREQAIIANVARYHRRSAPKSRHEAYMALASDDRELVKKLSTMLRLANSLDRGHCGNIRGLECTVDERRINVLIEPHDDPSVEIQATRFVAPHFERVFGRQLDVQIADRRLRPVIDNSFGNHEGAPRTTP